MLTEQISFKKDTMLLRTMRHSLALILVTLTAMCASQVSNVALSGQAVQSSTFNIMGVASNAIDGSTASGFSSGSCTHTDEESNPWWVVDLKAEYHVLRISITNRGDCCSEWLDGAEIRLGNSIENGGTTNPRCATISSLNPGETRSFYCENSRGQFVTINQPNGGMFSLCEVQVFAEKSDPTTELGSSHSQLEPKEGEQVQMSVPNVAPEGKVFQSSTYDLFGDPENAVDGSTSVEYIRGHCTHTELEINPWWTVDLTEEFQVSRVSITNRGDCCPERINNAEIRIGNSPEKGGITNPRCATISSLGPGRTAVFDCGEMEGQYVTVTIPGIGYLTLCEVQVFGMKVNTSETTPGMNKEAGVTSAIEKWTKPKKPIKQWKDKRERQPYSFVHNAALGGKAFQSSSYNLLASPDHAIDGSTSANYLRGQCTHTLLQDNPWWMVDLGARFRVLSVVVTNRGDCCADRIRGAEIRIGDSKERGGIRNPRCTTITSLNLGETGKFECDEMLGRYVTITIPDTNRYLSLCEVQVFGQLLIPPIPNVALDGKAFQSSSYSQLGAAEHAIDGSLVADFGHGSCTHTDYELNPWWMVDLKAEFNVTRVDITNREDCCAYRLDGAEIRIGNSRETGGSTNPRCAVISSIGRGETESFDCKGMKGQYVTVTIPEEQYLTLCEVEVFGVRVDSTGNQAVLA
ncbi:uncharacterized protein LOC121930412 [Sceloporus undulatus]|uniref:uncharacterized protein LOC121930412 n=1 Tax=Sceloporus undulatus TaxID=8520 RepID=UPI001C4CF16E|nr:uncharacterized protein LOC121930412 [Sceloporus undulatus]